MNAPYFLTIRFVSGLKPQEVRFKKRPKSLRLVNQTNGWSWLYVNGLPYVKFPAEAANPFEEMYVHEPCPAFP